MIYPNADPRLNITEQSLNNAIDIGMATSGGGLTTKPVMGSLAAMPGEIIGNAERGFVRELPWCWARPRPVLAIGAS